MTRRFEVAVVVVVCLLAGALLVLWLLRETIYEAAFPLPAPTEITVVDGGPAEAGGLIDGDEIVSLNGVEVGTWEELVAQIQDHDGPEITVRFLRNGDTQTLNIEPEWRLTRDGAEGLHGLYARDFILEYEGQPVATYAEFAELARQDIGEQVNVDVRLQGQAEPLSFLDDDDDDAGFSSLMNSIAIANSSTRTLKRPSRSSFFWTATLMRPTLSSA